MHREQLICQLHRTDFLVVGSRLVRQSDALGFHLNAHRDFG